MNLRLQRLLLKLGELRRGSPPSRHEVSTGSGIDLVTMTKIFSLPQTRLRLQDTEKLVGYLFREFRPLLSEEVPDDQLWNHLRFELFDFDGEAARKPDAACAYNPEGKYTLKDLLS